MAAIDIEIEAEAARRDAVWVRYKREKDELCQQRRGKIIEALIIWGALGLATSAVAGVTGLARMLLNNWDRLR